MKKHLLLYLAIIVSSSACRQNAAKKLPVLLTKTRQVILPINYPIIDLGKTNIRHFYDPGNNREYLTILDRYKEKLTFYDNKTGQPVKTVELRNVFKNKDYIDDYFVKAPDSIFVLGRNSNFAALCDSSGTSVKIWQIDKPMSNGNKNYELYTAGDFHYQNHNLYAVQGNNGFNVIDKKTRKDWFKENNGVILNISAADIKLNNVIGAFPEAFQENSYNSFNPYTTVNNRGEFIFSFRPLSEIYLYEVNGKAKKVEVKSTYYQKMNYYNEDSLLNRKYTERYEIENSRYTGIYYDKYRNVYYRVYLHSAPYEKGDGTINTIDDRNWSLMIIDKDFNLIGEPVFKGQEYNFRNLLITKEGILIRKNLAKPVNGSYFVADIFKVKTDA